MGYDYCTRVTRSALAAHHHRYTSDKVGGLTYALCGDTALREEFESPDDVYMSWAALLMETFRIQMGDPAFGAFLQCVVDTNNAAPRWESREDHAAASAG